MSSMQRTEVVMHEERFEALLATMLEEHADLDENDDDVVVAEVVTFRDAGVLTRNAGLVVRLDDGTEFQITIVRSK